MRPVDFVVAGLIEEEFIIDIHGRAFQSIMGGSALYCASGFLQPGNHAGILSLINPGIWKDWKLQFEKNHWDTRGTIVRDNCDMRIFYAYCASKVYPKPQPAAIYASQNLVFPKELLDYEANDDENRELFKETSNQVIQNPPKDYLRTSAVHLCPLDLKCHLALTSLFQTGGTNLLTLQTHPSYMMPDRWPSVQLLTNGLTAFITTRKELDHLFMLLTNSVHDMVHYLCSLNCRYVVIIDKNNGYLLYNSQQDRFVYVSDYPVKISDPTGCQSVLCGAFLKGLSNQMDAQSALCQASATCSIKKEVTGPLGIGDALPELIGARINAIHGMSYEINDAATI